jgi:hypothetical protein
MGEDCSARSVVVNLTEYLARRRGRDGALARAHQELPIFARVPDQQHERQLAHRRRMLDYLAAEGLKQNKA